MTRKVHSPKYQLMTRRGFDKQLVKTKHIHSLQYSYWSVANCEVQMRKLIFDSVTKFEPERQLYSWHIGIQYILNWSINKASFKEVLYSDIFAAIMIVELLDLKHGITFCWSREVVLIGWPMKGTSSANSRKQNWKGRWILEGIISIRRRSSHFRPLVRGPMPDKERACLQQWPFPFKRVSRGLSFPIFATYDCFYPNTTVGW